MCAALSRQPIQASEPGPVGALMEGRPVNATQRLVQVLMGTGPQAQTAKDHTYKLLVDALTGPTGPAAQKFALGLEDAYKRSSTNGQLARALGLMGTGAAAGAGLSMGGFGLADAFAPKRQ